MNAAGQVSTCQGNVTAAADFVGVEEGGFGEVVAVDGDELLLGYDVFELGSIKVDDGAFDHSTKGGFLGEEFADVLPSFGIGGDEGVATDDGTDPEGGGLYVLDSRAFRVFTTAGGDGPAGEGVDFLTGGGKARPKVPLLLMARPGVPTSWAAVQ